MTLGVLADYPKLNIIVTSVNSLESYSLTDMHLFVKSGNYIANLPTILYSFGYTENINASTIQVILKAYQKRGGFNFLVADWSAYDSEQYLTIVQGQLRGMGEVYGKKLYEMQSNGSIDLNTWHFIGHSLGAHMSGYIARAINQISSKTIKIKRITALDPAGPMMYDLIDYLIRMPLRKTDGKFFILDKSESCHNFKFT